MTAARRDRPSGVSAFLHGLGEMVIFALTVIGELAAFLVGHWDVGSPDVAAGGIDIEGHSGGG